MKTTTTNDRPNVWELTTLEEELNLCATIRYIDLRAMHQSNGTDRALQDLITGCYTDQLWQNTASRQAQADRAKAQAKEHRTIADQARKLLSRVRVSDEDRTRAYEILQEETTLADNDQGESHDIEQQNSTLTASLAQDMLHAIWLELQAIKADPSRQTETAFSELCKAGREFIQSLTSVTAIDSTKTIKRPLSKTESIYYMNQYNADPKARPRQKWTQTAKGCTGYYTLEGEELKRDTDPSKVDPSTIANYARYNDSCIWYFENITLPSTKPSHTPAYTALNAKDIATHFWHRLTQAEKATALGLDPADNPILYLVLHVPTIRKYTPMEETTDHDSRTAQQISTSTLDNINIPALAERAKLALQARTAIQALTHPQAIEQAQQAYKATIAKGQASIEKLQADRAKAGKKPYSPSKLKQMQDQYKTTADNAYSTALWTYALDIAGYTAHAKAKSTITAKLTQALKTAPDSLTAGQIDYAKLMQSTHRGHTDTPAQPLDAIKLWTTAKAVTIIDRNGNPHSYPIKAPAKAVSWTESAHQPQPTTGKDSRAEEVLLRDSYRATAPKATPPARTPREQAQWEKLCRRECELADLWRAFESGDPIPEYLRARVKA